MTDSQFLRRYNQIALAVLLTALIVVLAYVAYQWWNADRLYDDYHSPASGETGITGDEHQTSEGTITAYSSEVPDDFEAVRDVRYVAMTDGEVVAVSDNPDARIYGERAIGDLGRIALVNTGTRGERPVFDIVFVRFPNLNRFVIARSIVALDTVQQLDDNSFSAIVWDTLDKARFIIVDSETGEIRTTRSLDFSNSTANADRPDPSAGVGDHAEAKDPIAAAW